MRIGEYPPGREIFMLRKKVEKKITLDQSKSLENVKVGKKSEQWEITKKQSRGTH